MLHNPFTSNGCKMNIERTGQHLITHKSSFCHHIEIVITWSPHQDKHHCRLWQEDGTKEEKSGGWLWRETLQSGQSGNLQTLKRTLLVAALFHGEHIWSSRVLYSAANSASNQAGHISPFVFVFCEYVFQWICALCSVLNQAGHISPPPPQLSVLPPLLPLSQAIILCSAKSSKLTPTKL